MKLIIDGSTWVEERVGLPATVLRTKRTTPALMVLVEGASAKGRISRCWFTEDSFRRNFKWASDP